MPRAASHHEGFLNDAAEADRFRQGMLLERSCRHCQHTLSRSPFGDGEPFPATGSGFVCLVCDRVGVAG